MSSTLLISWRSREEKYHIIIYLNFNFTSTKELIRRQNVFLFKKICNNMSIFSIMVFSFIMIICCLYKWLNHPLLVVFAIIVTWHCSLKETLFLVVYLNDSIRNGKYILINSKQKLSILPFIINNCGVCKGFYDEYPYIFKLKHRFA